MTLTEKRDDILRGYSKENFKYIRNALRNIYKILGQDEKLKEIDKFTAAQLLKDTRLKNDVSDEDDYEDPIDVPLHEPIEPIEPQFFYDEDFFYEDRVD